MEFLPKDVYEYLTQFGEDKDILNMLKVNKYFNKIINDNFFERVIRRKYPLLAKMKDDKKTWKNFYLSVVKYIYKLEEEFGIPYIPYFDYYPEEFYNYNHGHKDIYNNAMIWAALGSDLKIVKLMIEKGANDFDRVMKLSPSVDIAKLMIENGANNLNEYMIDAIENEAEDIELMKLLIQNGANNFNQIMSFISRLFTYKPIYIEIIKLMIENGADNFNETMNFAAEETMNFAAEEGKIEIVKLMIENGADDFNKAMGYAAYKGNIEIVKLMIENGADDFNKVMEYAAYKGNIELIKLMIENGADNFTEVMRIAKLEDNTEIVKLISLYIN